MTNNPNRVAVFVDNSNVFLNVKQYQRNGEQGWCSSYDPKRLAERLAGNRPLSYIGFYCAPPPAYLASGNEADKNRYALGMRYYGLVSKLKDVDVHYATVNGSRGNLQEKNLDTKMTADIVSLAAKNVYDVAILVSSDADFVSAMTTAQELGKRVEILYFKGSASMELRRKADLARRIRPSFLEGIDGFHQGYTYVPRQQGDLFGGS